MTTPDTRRAELRNKIDWILDTRHTVPVGTKSSEVYGSRIEPLINSEALALLDRLEQKINIHWGTNTVGDGLKVAIEQERKRYI